jgi:hypothetical protein
MNLKRTMLATCLASAISIPAYASNFSYTYVGAALGTVKLDEELEFSGEIYRRLGYFSISAGYQFTENVAISFTSAAAANEGNTTELTESTAMMAIHFPFAVSRTMDIVPFVGYASLEAEACQFNICGKFDDSGLVYGVDLKVWIVPGQFELGAGYAGSDIEDLDSVVSLRGAMWFQDRHRVSLNHSVSDFDKETTLGYTYHW